MPIIIGALKLAATGIFKSVIEPYVDDAKNAAANAAKNMVEGAVAGKRTIDDWAEIAVKGIDTIKDRAIKEDGLRYVGGKLKFAMSGEVSNNVIISFELFFQDENREWHKIGADSEVSASNFTIESLEEIQSTNEVSFEVE